MADRYHRVVVCKGDWKVDKARIPNVKYSDFERIRFKSPESPTGKKI